MKKRFFIFLLLLFACAVCFADIVELFSTEKKWTITNGIMLENGSDFAPNTALRDLSVSLDMQELYVSSGIQFKPESFDFTTEVIYWPLFWNCLNLGVGSIYHLLDYYNEFIEFDFLTGIYARYDNRRFIKTSLNILYFRKAACIEAVKDYIPWITNNNLAIETDVEIKAFSLWTFYFRFSSYSYYRYMLWFAPDFQLGAQFRINRFLSVGTEVEIQYIDMFTLSANFNSLGTRLFFKMEF